MAMHFYMEQQNRPGCLENNQTKGKWVMRDRSVFVDIFLPFSLPVNGIGLQIGHFRPISKTVTWSSPPKKSKFLFIGGHCLFIEFFISYYLSFTVIFSLLLRGSVCSLPPLSFFRESHRLPGINPVCWVYKEHIIIIWLTTTVWATSFTCR